MYEQASTSLVPESDVLALFTFRLESLWPAEMQVMPWTYLLCWFLELAFAVFPLKGKRQRGAK